MADGSSDHDDAPAGEGSVGPPDFDGLSEALRRLPHVASEKDGLACLAHLRECLASITAVPDEALWEDVCDGLVAGSVKGVSSEATPLYGAIKKLVIKLHADKLKKIVRQLKSPDFTKGIVGIIRQVERSPAGACKWVKPKMSSANRHFRSQTRKLQPDDDDSDAASSAPKDSAGGRRPGTRGARAAAPLAKLPADAAEFPWPAAEWTRSPADEASPAAVYDARHGVSATADAVVTAAASDIASTAMASPARIDEFLAIVAELQSVARHVCRGTGHRVALYGSVATGLASAKSDLDCVFVGSGARASMTADDVRAEAAERSGKTRRRGVFAAPPPMKTLDRELARGPPTAFRVVETIGFARIPILRLLHVPTKTDIDLSFNSIIGVHNSRLLHSYMSFDMLKRAAPLATLVKRWAKRRNINDSSRDTLSSFAYTLMVVFYLQQRGVVPNLQAPGLLRAYEGWRGKKMPAVTVHGFKLRYCADDAFLAKLAEYRLESGRLSVESLGSLLVGFFTYYASVFDWESSAVSVRLGRPRPRKGWAAGVRGRMGIEDPFEDERDLCATLGKNGRLRGQDRIMHELNRARYVMMRGLSGDAGRRGVEAALAELMAESA